jgi:plasmid stabilization system protein ParE
MTPYHVTPAADADLDAQAAYLAREAGMDTALRFSEG